MDSTLDVFIEDVEFLATLRCDEISVSSVQVKLSYSIAYPYNIKGTIIGNQDKYHEISPLFNIRHKISLSSDIKNSDLIFFCSDIFIFDSPHKDISSNEVATEIYEFKLNELYLYNYCPQIWVQSISFYLAGSQRVWDWISRTDIRGGRLIHLSKTIEIDADIPFSIELKEEYIEKKHKFDNKTKTSYENLVITFKEISNKSTLPLSEKEFVDRCIEIINDILLLISFNGGARIDWYRYIYTYKKKQTRYFKSNVIYDKSLANRLNLAGFRKSFDFIKHSLPVFWDLKKNHFDLTIVLKYYISHYSMQFIEGKFTNLFITLEYLKTLYADKNDLNGILEKEIFKTLRKSVKKFCKSKEVTSLINEKDKLKMIKEKLGELNRYSIRYLLDKMCIENGFKLEEFYDDENVTLLKTRNDLFHKTAITDMDTLIKDLNILKKVLDKLLLSYLDWNTN